MLADYDNLILRCRDLEAQLRELETKQTTNVVSAEIVNYDVEAFKKAEDKTKDLSAIFEKPNNRIVREVILGN